MPISLWRRKKPRGGWGESRKWSLEPISIVLNTSFTIFTETNAPCLPLKILHNHCFQFPLGITVIPREIEDNGYAKFWGVHRVHYGLGENGQYQLLIHLMIGQLWRFEIWHFHRRNGFSGSGQTEVFKKDAYRLSPSSTSEKKRPWLTKPRMPRDSAVPSLFPPFFAHSLFSVVSRLYISSALTVTPHWHRLSSVEANNFHMFFYFFMQFTVSLSTIQLHNVCNVNIFTIINLLCYNLANDSKKSVS